MLDTILIHILDLKEHHILRSYLELKTKNSTTNYLRVIPYEELVQNGLDVEREMIHYGETGKTYFKSHHVKMVLPSWHYDIVTNVNYPRDRIEISLSLPKYLYGHNIAQFIRSTKYGNLSSEMFDPKNQAKDLYHYLRKFLQKFFRDVFYKWNQRIVINYTLVELRRVDFCFNQIYESEWQAREALKSMQFMYKRYQRKDKVKYDTSFTYSSDGYYCKVYHKGEDYKVHDRKEHERINKEVTGKRSRDGFFKKNPLKKEPFDINYLQKLADRTLRFEFEFRVKKMSQIYKNNVYGRKNRMHKMYINDYNRINSISKGGTEWVKNNHLGKIIWKASQDDRRLWKYFNKWYNTQCRFFLEVNDFEEGYENNDIPIGSNLFYEMFKEFWSFVKTFRVQKMEKDDVVLSRLKEHNDRVKSSREAYVNQGYSRADARSITANEIGVPIDENKIKGVLSAIKRYGSLGALKKENVYDRRTWYRYKDNFETLGVSLNHVSSELHKMDVSLDYKLYYNEEIQNFHKLKPFS